MNPVERNVLPKRGPRFYRGPDDGVLFEFVVDPTNVIGPRPATRADQDKHAGAWAEFIAAEGVSPLDRDADEQPGGSLPAEPVVTSHPENSQGQPEGFRARRGRKARA